MKHSITILTALLLLAVTSAVHADALKTNLSAGVVFEEDFESPEDYQKRWQATSGWSLMEGQIDGRKTKVLDIQGGNEGLSVRGGLADFDYEADVRVVNQGGGFLFRARDADNLYMLRGQTVEPVFGQIKDARGIDKFMRRGFEACRSEWSLICATHNLLKLWRSGKACWN